MSAKSRDIEEIIEDFNSLRIDDFERKDGFERIESLCAEISVEPDFDRWAPVLFSVMERLADEDEVDLGSPGAIVHALEQHIPDYEAYLYRSVKSRPTSLTVWMVDRLLRGDREDRSRWTELLYSVLDNENATFDAKDCVMDSQSQGII